MSKLVLKILAFLSNTRVESHMHHCLMAESRHSVAVTLSRISGDLLTLSGLFIMDVSCLLSKFHGKNTDTYR